jgi:hypothetical protein
MDAMTWHVQYRRDTIDHVVMHPSPEAAKGAILRPSVFIEQPEHDFAEFGAGIF